ncbi:MAG: SIMPL domain-containing protein, partial [Hyphomicrobiales bacterium]
MKIMKLMAACAALTCAGIALADTPPPQNVLQLSANGTVEVQQDLLSMTLSTTREATEAATV